MSVNFSLGMVIDDPSILSHDTDCTLQLPYLGLAIIVIFTGHFKRTGRMFVV